MEEIKKKVLLLTDELRVGGAETYFFKIENNFKSESVELFTAAEVGSYESKLKNNDKFFSLTESFFKNIFLVREIVKKNEIDIIHANSLRLSMISLLSKYVSLGKVKIFYTKHNLTYLEQINDKVFSSYVNKFIDKLLTVSDFDRKVMIIKGVNESKIEVVRNSTDVEKMPFNPHYFRRKKDEPLKIGILARLSEVKNHKFFIDIIEDLTREKLFEFNTFIGGDGPLRDEIETDIKDRELDIKVLGLIDNPGEFLKEMDVVLIVSKREIFPMTILEAFSIGTIVVSIDVGGVSDCIKNNNTGYLIDNYSTKQFINALLNISENITSTKELILNARKMVSDGYSLNKMMVKIEEIYMED
ncbi:glycosyltransferase family 4 protein [Clostridium gasigenes]|uniref:glycosyltransferase family 4 protein n=1 Tax=Clostridium gasigenes TaxID=94869 RepID=UPI001C0BC899|nr:glycosyltransferase family 4 protein [Clostridium gasigenes]